MTFTTVAIASSRRGSDEDPGYVDPVLWDAQAAFAVEHLLKDRAVTFAGRLEPRAWGEQTATVRACGTRDTAGARRTRIGRPKTAP